MKIKIDVEEDTLLSFIKTLDKAADHLDYDGFYVLCDRIRAVHDYLESFLPEKKEQFHAEWGPTYEQDV